MVNRQVNRRDKGARGSFDYTPSDPKKLRQRAANSGGSFDSYFKPGIDMYKPKQGENAVRICPPTFKDHTHFGLNVWVHGFVGPDRASFLCPKKMLNKKCAVCVAQMESHKAGEKEEADQMKAKERVVYWLLDREGDDPELPLIWSVSKMADGEISGRCEKRSGKILELDNPYEGHDLTFRRTGQQLKTRYLNWDVETDATPLLPKSKATERVLAFLKENPLDQILKYHTYEQMEAAVSGGGDEKDEDLEDEDETEDEDESPKSRRGREDEDEDEGRGKKSRQRSRDEDEDEDEDERPSKSKSRRDADEDDEDEDDRTSRRKRRDADADEDEDEDERPAKRKSKSRDDDEDEDDPADEDDAEDEDGDDEDDPPPKKKSRVKARKDEDDEDEDDEPRKRRNSRPRDEDEDEDDEIPSSRRAKRTRS